MVIGIPTCRLFSFGLLSAALAVALSFGCGSDSSSDGGAPGDVVTTYSFDAEGKVWTESASVLESTSAPTGGNTIIIQLKPDEPVKEVSLNEVLLINSPSEPTLEIAGSDNPSGELHICKLVFEKVDANDFVVQDTDAVTFTAVNVVGDNSLQINVNPVNDVRCGRGGVAAIALGVPIGGTSSVLSSLVVTDTDGHQGLRDNRIKILGPSGDNGFIETLIVKNSSVFGRIELRHLRVQEFILDTVTVDNP